MSNPNIQPLSPRRPLFSAELWDALDRSDREYLAARVKLRLDVEETPPSASFTGVAHLARPGHGSHALDDDRDRVLSCAK